MPHRPPLRVAIAVGLVAGCTLALQVLLTRLFSSALFYHFAFFAISLALLGTGAGALLVYVRPRWFDPEATERLMARWSAAFAVTLLVVPALLVRLDYEFRDFDVTVGFASTLALAALLSALPFLAAGVAIALAIRRYVASAGRIYAFDLAGAGLGAVVVVPLLWVASAPTLTVALAVVAAVAALLLAAGGGPERTAALAVAGLALGLTVLAGATSLYRLPAPFEELARPVADRWTPISRVVGYAPSARGTPALVTYDQDVAPVPRRRPGGPLPDWRDLGLGPQSIGYRLTGPGHALIIGGGGGRDIYNALTSGQRRVDVIELNRRIREIVDGRLSGWSGRPYSLPRVSVAIGDGRSTLAARDTRYDQVHIGFTNTLTAGAGSAYALSENNLYTVEAFDEYLDHLAPGGILSVSRPYRFAGDEALRTTVLALEALRERGVRDPQRHVIVMVGTDALNQLFGTVLTRLEPFTAAELAAVRRLAGERRAEVAYMPGGPYSREWRGLAASDDLDRFCADYPVNVCAPTDDKPFFLNPTRLGDLGEPLPEGSTFITRGPFVVLLVALGILLVLAALAFVLPLAVVRRTRRPPVSSLVFFGAIGVGFLLLEVALIQRFVLFLGFPTYALSVVLFSLLMFTGAGAALSARWAEPRRALVLALGAAALLMALAAVGLQPLLRTLIDLPFAVRVAVTVALLAPLGLTLGTAMPVGLRRLAALHPDGVPWAWGVNGITSVLASVLAMFIAINFGFGATTVAALLCYLVAIADAARGRWAPEEVAAPPVATPAPPPEAQLASR